MFEDPGLRCGMILELETLLVTNQKAGIIGGFYRNPADVGDTGSQQHIGQLLFAVGLARIRAQKHIQGKQGREKGAVHTVV